MLPPSRLLVDRLVLLETVHLAVHGGRQVARVAEPEPGVLEALVGDDAPDGALHLLHAALVRPQRQPRRAGARTCP